MGRPRVRGTVLLWLLALLTYGLGDGATTLYLLEHAPAVSEANPLVRRSFRQFGPWGVVGLKQLVIYVLLGLSLYSAGDSPARFDPLPPAILVVFGTVVTISNAVLLFG